MLPSGLSLKQQREEEDQKESAGRANNSTGRMSMSPLFHAQMKADDAASASCAQPLRQEVPAPMETASLFPSVVAQSVVVEPVLLTSDEGDKLGPGVIQGSENASLDLNHSLLPDEDKWKSVLRQNSLIGRTSPNVDMEAAKAEAAVHSPLPGSETCDSPPSWLWPSARGYSEQQQLSDQSQGMLRASVSLLSGSKGRYHSVQRGAGIGKHTNAGRGVGRTSKLAHVDVAVDIGASPHVLLTSPRILRSPGRKRSPIRWFPRKKTESYLERKIRMLQEKEGTVASLDETLGAANLHLSRIEREKLAAQAAAAEAMDARKGALIEASWCRILKFAGIPCKVAILELQKAEKKASAALAEAENHGVILQNGPAEREPASEAVTASLDTAFDVDKEVTAAIKVALQHISWLPGCGGENLSDMQSEINQINGECTDLGDIASCALETSSEAESQSEFELERERSLEESMSKDSARSPSGNRAPKPRRKSQEKSRIQQSLISLIVKRMTDLSADHRASLAGIVATRGLSALLKDQNLEQELNEKTPSAAVEFMECGSLMDGVSPKKASDLGSILPKHVSRLQQEVQESKEPTRQAQTEVDKRLGPSITQFEGLDQVLVKHVSRLEKERLAVQATKRTPSRGLKKSNFVADEVTPSLAEFLKKPPDQNKTWEGTEGGNQNFCEGGRKMLYEVTNTSLSSQEANQEKHIANYVKRSQTLTSNDIPDLGSILVKHVSRLEQEKQAALRMQGFSSMSIRKVQSKCVCDTGLDEVLVKSVPKLEKGKILNMSGAGAVQPATGQVSAMEIAAREKVCKSSASGPFLLSEDHQLESRAQESCKTGMKTFCQLADASNELAAANSAMKKNQKSIPEVIPDLGSILVKHMSRLEIEKQAALKTQEKSNMSARKVEKSNQPFDAGLGEILVKRLSKLEIEKANLSRLGIFTAVRPTGVGENPESCSLHELNEGAVSREEDATALAKLHTQQSITEHSCIGQAPASSVIGIGERETSSAGKLVEATWQRAKSLRSRQMENTWGGLILQDAIPSVQSLGNNQTKMDKSSSRRKSLREKQMEDAWGGLSLGNVLKRHVSKLEIEQDAWRRAEEEARQWPNNG